MANQTTYIDANGEKKTGYIIDNRTYTDEAGTTQVGAGSIVNAGGQQYIKTDNGSQLYSDYLKQNGITTADTKNADTGMQGTGYVQNGVTYSDPLLKNKIGEGTVVNTKNGDYIKTANGSMLYSDYLKQQEQKPKDLDNLQQMLNELDAAYQSALAANNQQYAAMLAQQKLNVQSQIDALNRGYQDLNKQLYRDYMQNQKNLPQALAAQGITGGLAESSLIGLAAGYEGNLSENERARLAGITDLENGVTDAQLQLSMKQAEANQMAADTRYERLAAILAAQQEQANYEKQLEAEAENIAYTRALNEAKLAAELGDKSKLYDITGAQQPQAMQPVYAPVYNPQPTTQQPKPELQKKPKTEGTTRDLSSFTNAALRVLQNYGTNKAIEYLNGRVANGALTAAEADMIAKQL